MATVAGKNLAVAGRSDPHVFASPQCRVAIVCAMNRPSRTNHSRQPDVIRCTTHLRRGRRRGRQFRFPRPGTPGRRSGPPAGNPQRPPFCKRTWRSRSRPVRRTRASPRLMRRVPARSRLAPQDENRCGTEPLHFCRILHSFFSRGPQYRRVATVRRSYSRRPAWERIPRPGEAAARPGEGRRTDLEATGSSVRFHRCR